MCPTVEQLLDTILFYQNSVEIYARFNDWKNNDRLTLWNRNERCGS